MTDGVHNPLNWAAPRVRALVPAHLVQAQSSSLGCASRPLHVSAGCYGRQSTTSSEWQDQSVQAPEGQRDQPQVGAARPGLTSRKAWDTP